MADFKLSAQLVGHDADVRHVCFPSPELILSAARDCTVRAWKRTSTSPPAFEPSVATKGSEFYNSLTYLPPSSDHPDGLIVSAGTDTIIDVRRATSAASDNAERLLVGHARNVCALAVVPGGRYIVSGSWDKTARIWSVNKWETEAILAGHEEAVWDVLPLDDTTVVTASADKNIRIYDLRTVVTGQVEPRSTIYTSDVIRALCRVPSGHPSGADFASASNDGVIRLWKLSGQKVGELHGHESFIYALDTLPSGELVSSGEDRTVRVWRGTECVQTITHPAISVWTVSVCSVDGDIVTGASDGVIRVFSRDPERLASPDTLAHFDESVKSSSIPQQQVGGINKEKLPGPEFLKTKSGTKEGQVQMIREENGSVTAHQWSMSQQQWVNVGTVVDAVGSSGRKVEYNGQSYDYVFDVAIEEGQPSLKLPYNLSENPYTRAQKFIDDNELSQNFLDQVAQFIITNTQGATIGQDSEGSGTESRHRPGDDPSSSKARSLPQREYLDITAAKYEPIIKKILSVSSSLEAAGRKDLSLNPPAQEVLLGLRQRLEANQPVVENASISLVVMMCTEWDYSDRLAPLDLFRCTATSPAVAKFRSANLGSPVQIAISAALEGIPPGAQPNENCAMMAARTIANLFRSTEGRRLLAQHSESLQIASFVDRVLGIGGQPPIGPYNRNLLIALTTTIVNLAVLASREPGSVSANVQVRLLTALARILQTQTEGEVIFRALVAAGTLITVIGKTAPEAKSLSSSIASSKERISEPRVKELADECLSLLR
ncbi:Ubiquitin homeostasis protein lub1 [Daldinia childiae]|uniref:Ubiquitin homeostasis protein lub1 n=1 Tax=Daldinia childiae TaxID=326645 RepID=UPI00144743E1|nr:Ubiquitin homeostasis protein lub1 [Daldinia childiae]KAF3054933.1 Ubiquitin homeostasis protein lub1 [Daldinia childiae]